MTAYIALVGDSVTRYQYLSLVYFLRTGKWHSTKPRLFCEKDWPSWNMFFKGTNAKLRGYEICDCDREGSVTLGFRENRFACFKYIICIEQLYLTLVSFSLLDTITIRYIIFRWASWISSGLTCQCNITKWIACTHQHVMIMALHLLLHTIQAAQRITVFCTKIEPPAITLVRSHSYTASLRWTRTVAYTACCGCCSQIQS